jgi:hypothetical protein
VSIVRTGTYKNREVRRRVGGACTLKGFFVFLCVCVCNVNCEGRSYCGLFEKIVMGWILLKAQITIRNIRPNQIVNLGLSI